MQEVISEYPISSLIKKNLNKCNQQLILSFQELKVGLLVDWVEISDIASKEQLDLIFPFLTHIINSELRNFRKILRSRLRNLKEHLFSIKQQILGIFFLQRKYVEH